MMVKVRNSCMVTPGLQAPRPGGAGHARGEVAGASVVDQPARGAVVGVGLRRAVAHEAASGVLEIGETLARDLLPEAGVGRLHAAAVPRSDLLELAHERGPGQVWADRLGGLEKRHARRPRELAEDVLLRARFGA